MGSKPHHTQERARVIRDKTATFMRAGNRVVGDGRTLLFVLVFLTASHVIPIEGARLPLDSLLQRI